jgi:hypothetical protein
MDERLRELEERLARAEEALRLLGASVAVPADGGVVLRGPLRVVDGAGAPLVEVSAGDSGASLRLMDASGSRVVVLDAIPTGGSLSICHHAGKPVVLMFADEAGGDFSLYDRDGEVQFTSP